MNIIELNSDIVKIIFGFVGYTKIHPCREVLRDWNLLLKENQEKEYTLNYYQNIKIFVYAQTRGLNYYKCLESITQLNNNELNIYILTNLREKVYELYSQYCDFIKNLVWKEDVKTLLWIQEQKWLELKNFKGYFKRNNFNYPFDIFFEVGKSINKKFIHCCINKLDERLNCQYLLLGQIHYHNPLYFEYENIIHNSGYELKKSIYSLNLSVFKETFHNRHYEYIIDIVKQNNVDLWKLFCEKMNWNKIKVSVINSYLIPYNAYHLINYSLLSNEIDLNIFKDICYQVIKNQVTGIDSKIILRWIQEVQTVELTPIEKRNLFDIIKDFDEEIIIKMILSKGVIKKKEFITLAGLQDNKYTNYFGNLFRNCQINYRSRHNCIYFEHKCDCNIFIHEIYRIVRQNSYKENNFNMPYLYD